MQCIVSVKMKQFKRLSSFLVVVLVDTIFIREDSINSIVWKIINKMGRSLSLSRAREWAIILRFSSRDIKLHCATWNTMLRLKSKPFFAKTRWRLTSLLGDLLPGDLSLRSLLRILLLLQIPWLLALHAYTVVESSLRKLDFLFWLNSRITNVIRIEGEVGENRKHNHSIKYHCRFEKKKYILI